MISLYGEVVLANLCISGPERDFIYYDSFWSYNCQWLDLMNQTSCVGNNIKIEEDVLVILFQIHNINQDKIQKYLFMFFLHEFSSYISFVGVSVKNYGN